jgi:hypothetical protein
MLSELTDGSKEVQRRWLRFILERVGHNNLPRLIDYYKGLGWISVQVGNRMLELAKEEKRYKGASWTLSAEEHRISMLYIEKLKGREINEALLSVPMAARAIPDRGKKIQIMSNEEIRPLHPVEKKKMEFMVHRREVTINILEQELEEKSLETGELKRRILELESELGECQKEIMRNRIYMEILDQNISLKNTGFKETKGNRPTKVGKAFLKNITHLY